MIKINNGSWRRDSLNLKAEQVIDLKMDGCIPPYLAISLLQQFYFVKNLTIVNESGFPCETGIINLTYRISSQFKTTLNNLMHINVANITNSNEVFTILANWFVMPSVKILKINTIILDNNNVFSARQLLYHIKFSIEVLDLLNILWETSLFAEIDFEFLNLYELRMDFVCQKACKYKFLARIPLYASNLRNLISEQGYLPYSENNQIMQLKKVEYLKYSLIVPIHEGVVDLAIFRVRCRNLKYFYLYIKFQNFTNCCIQGKEILSGFFITEIGSNCVFNCIE